MMPLMGRLVLTALMFGAVFVPLGSPDSVRGQVDETLTVQIASVDASALPTLTVTVNVLDATQRPVLGLDAGAFQATLGGPALRVASVASAEDSGLGIAVVLTFDVSGSMEGAALAGAKEAGKSLISQLGPADQAAVLAFSDSVATVQAFTQDKGALTTAIDGLFVSGNTALYSAVVASTEAVRAPTAPRRAVVLLSDGTDFGGGSEVDAEGSLAAVQASGVPFFVAGLGELIDQPYLEQLAAASRGQLLLAPDPAALDALYQNIGDILRHQYVLTLDASIFEAIPAGELAVTVTTPAGSGTAVAAVDLPIAPSPAATVTDAPSAAPSFVAGGEEEADDSSSSRVVAAIALAAGVGGVLVVVLAYVWDRRLRKPAEADAEPAPSPREAPAPVYQPVEIAVPATASGAYVEVLTPGGAQTHPIGDSATVGYASDCSVQLDGGGETRWEVVRIWRREGRYMVHNLSRLGGVSVGGKPVTWAVLEEGDELAIGPQKVIFHEGADRG